MALGPGAEFSPPRVNTALGRLGDFEVLGELGRGGMGVVYEARQISLNRKVALKVLSGGLGLTPKAVARFKREAEAAAKLHHTNIVPIYATGEEDGTHFYAMELIAGPSLDKVIRTSAGIAGRDEPSSQNRTGSADQTVIDAALNRRGDRTDVARGAETTTSFGEGNVYFDTVARMIAEVADALDYAHRQGVIHRDIKPSNLLLSPEGRLSVNDFGLARVLEEPGMTLSGEFIGSPLYMSPEQIAAGRTPLDRRTDIYSLGATLYQLITLAPPFAGDSRDQILGQILHKEPRRPRAVNRKIPLDLETICLKAMEKDPDARYQHACEMAEDLRRYVNRFAISARRAGLLARAVKWSRRHPAVAAALGACLVLAVCAIGFAAKARQSGRELLAQKRELVLNSALTVAMSGDFKLAEKAIKAAEVAGVSPGEVRMLRGLVEFQGGDLDRAEDELRQAVTLSPKSIPALSLLAVVYNHSFRWAQYAAQLEELDRLTPTTPEDHLLKGYALSFVDPRAALTILDEAIRMRDTAIARALRVEARTMASFDGAGLKQAEQMLLDGAVARENLPDHPFVLFANLYASISVASIYERAGDHLKREQVLEQARRDAALLEPMVHLTDALFGLWSYWNYSGQESKAREALRKLWEQRQTPSVAYPLALQLFTGGEWEEAGAVLEKVTAHNVGFDVMRALVAAERTGSGQASMAIYREALKKFERRRYEEMVLQVIPLFLGDFPAAIEGGRQVMQNSPPLPKYWKPGFDRPLSYIAGTITAEELLRNVADSQLDTAMAYHVIALRKIGEGDREAARAALKKGVAIPSFGYGAFDISKAILHRMEQDPDWPRWIRSGG